MASNFGVSSSEPPDGKQEVLLSIMARLLQQYLSQSKIALSDVLVLGILDGRILLKVNRF